MCRSFGELCFFCADVSEHSIFCVDVSEHPLCSIFIGRYPRPLNFMCRGFGALCLFHLPRSLTYENGTECSETAAHKIQMPGITTYENGTGRVFRNVGTENSDAGKSLKRINFVVKISSFFLLQLSDYTCRRPNQRVVENVIESECVLGVGVASVLRFQLSFELSVCAGEFNCRVACCGITSCM
jgi:hypothetical protein